MKKTLTEIRDFVLHELAKIKGFSSKLMKYTPAIAQFFGKVLALADNPEIDAISDIIIGAQLTDEIIAAIHWAIDLFTKGTAIADDIAKAQTLQEKLIVLLQDLLKYDPSIKKMHIGDIAALVVKFLGGDNVDINTATQLIEAEIAHMKGIATAA